MKLLSLQQLLALHVLVVGRFGGSDGIRDMGRLASAIAGQEQQVFDTPLYETVFDKAAALARAVIGDHPFVDGNKRTGILIALTLIELNGYTVQALPGELEDFAVKIAVDHLDIPAIAAWFEQHSQTS